MIRLIPQDAPLLQSLSSARQFREVCGADVSGHLELAREVVEQTLALAAERGARAPWGGYLTVDPASGAVVGSCGFKGNPTGQGWVEIAYFTFPPFEGRGFASAMASELIKIARASPEVRCILAHTLPKSGASTRILEKTGFSNVGAVIDPEDGRIWQWRLETRS